MDFFLRNNPASQSSSFHHSFIAFVPNPSGVSEPSFLPLHSLMLRPKLRSRSLRAQKAATLTLSIPSAFRHRAPAPPHIPTPQAEARSLPAEKRPQAPARQAVRSLAPRAERPQPCARPHSAGFVAAAAPLTLPHGGPRAAGKRQSGRESQPQAPDTPCPHSYFSKKNLSLHPHFHTKRTSKQNIGTRLI